MNLYYFNVNKVCNSNCRFCAANYEKLYLNRNNSSFISIDKFKQIFIQMGISKGDRIIINGCEPTLNPHLLDILEFCSSNDINTVLFTNGRKLSDSVYAQSIIRNNISKITIPLYAHNAELHNYITRNENSFEETVTALKQLSDLKNTNQFELEIKILICQANYDYIVEIAKYIMDNFKFDILVVSGLIPSDIAIKNNQVVSKELHKKTINSFLDFYWKYHNKPRLLLLDGIPLCHLDKKNLILYLMYRKSTSESEISKPNCNYYIDVENLNEIKLSSEIEKWNEPICIKKDCQYTNICRLNTLINHTDYLEEWIS